MKIDAASRQSQLSLCDQRQTLARAATAAAQAYGCRHLSETSYSPLFRTSPDDLREANRTLARPLYGVRLLSRALLRTARLERKFKSGLRRRPRRHHHRHWVSPGNAVRTFSKRFRPAPPERTELPIKRRQFVQRIIR